MKILGNALFLIGTLALAQTPAKDAKKANPVPAKTAPAATPKAEAKPAAVGIIANKDSKTFHKADCKMAMKMKAENKTTFASRTEAEKAGFKACKVCKP